MQDLKKILITGTAGFIGSHLVSRLLKESFTIVGIDSINDYYDIDLKINRLKQHGIISTNDYKQGFKSNKYPSYTFYKADISSKEDIDNIIKAETPDVIINLAAQAGVRYSLSHPDVYLKSNIDGFLNLLEACRYNKVKHLIYASSSSVYGLNKKMPFSTNDPVDHPISLYAATKKSNELMAHTYSYLFGLPTTGLRFFTVYGPWGRPDMALFKFTKAILENSPVQLFNNGDMIRDFTYVDDIVESVFRLISKPPEPGSPLELLETPATSIAPYRIFNVGNNEPVRLVEFLGALERKIGRKARIDFQPMQAGDVRSTHADVADLASLIEFTPSTPIETGISNFVDWYLEYYQPQSV